MSSVDENETCDVVRVGDRVEANHQAAKGMPCQDIRTRYISRNQQAMQVLDNLSRGTRHGDRVATAVMLMIEDGPGTVIGTDTGEGSYTGEDCRPCVARRESSRVPGLAIVSSACLEDDRGTASATAFQVEPAPVANVDQSRKVLTLRAKSCGCWSGRLEQNQQRH